MGTAGDLGDRPPLKASVPARISIASSRRSNRLVVTLCNPIIKALTHSKCSLCEGALWAPGPKMWSYSAEALVSRLSCKSIGLVAAISWVFSPSSRHEHGDSLVEIILTVFDNGSVVAQAVAKTRQSPKRAKVFELFAILFFSELLLASDFSRVSLKLDHPLIPQIDYSILPRPERQKESKTDKKTLIFFLRTRSFLRLISPHSTLPSETILPRLRLPKRSWLGFGRSVKLGSNSTLISD